LSSFNELTERQAIGTLYDCCSSTIWAIRVAAARPFSDDEALLEYADLILAELSEGDLDEALSGHPRIGDRADNPSSAREQSGVTGADASVLAELKDLNAAYEDRFGHVYLVFANGRPAAELLAILKQRMRNDPATERRVMRAELAKINRSRLIRMLAPAGNFDDAGATS
jgi:2-oxo-4-hydroxy-4-carboxy-5-ureidoimidazoline decarboxylase